MKQLPLFILSFFILIIFSCEEESIPSAPDDNIETIIPTGNEKYLTTNSDYIFNQESLHTFELNIPESALNKIDADPVKEEYVEGTLTFEGETLSPVGIRYKGSVGAFVNCLSGSDWANPSGYKTCTKLSMKIKINWLDSDNTFYGLKKLQFHSQNLDPSQMRERLGYWLFREMGVPASRSVHARLIINGDYIGVFALTEQIDGRFTRYHFDNGKGNLYKEVWPLDMNGQVQRDEVYLRNLKTNEDENPAIEMIKDFALDVASADSTNIKEVIRQWMNVEEIIAFAVVDRTIRNDDGPFHWYCNNGICSNHNYYWYEEPVGNKLHLIPWDLDNAFENIIKNANPVTPIADEWGGISSNCDPFRYEIFSIQQRSATCDKLTAGWQTLSRNMTR
jgi:spore coat protein CotH